VASTAFALGIIAGAGMLIIGMKKPERALLLIAAAALGWAFLASKARARKTNWLLACTATFAVLFAGINVLLPEYARRFSLRHRVRRQVAAGTPVVCYPHRWESVGFYADRRDIQEFRREDRQALMRDLEARPRTLLLIQSKHLVEVLDDLPPSLEFHQRQADGAVTIGEVRRRREARPLIAAR